jgi:hypothetical protein
MEAQGDEGMVRHRRKLVVLGTALPAASEAGHSGHLLAPTGKVLPTRLPRSGLVQSIFQRWPIPAPSMCRRQLDNAFATVASGKSSIPASRRFFRSYLLE